MQKLRSVSNVRTIVPPADADAQIAWMLRENVVDFGLVPSNDSDLLVYQVRGVVFNPDVQPEHISGAVIHETVTDQKVLRGILSGCDYFKQRGKSWMSGAWVVG